jgi:hypothetical protein
MDLPAEVSSCPKVQTKSGVAAEEPSSLHELRELVAGSADLKTLDYKLWSVLEDTVCRKCHYSLESLTRSLMKAMPEISLETGAWSDSRLAGDSRGEAQSGDFEILL